VLSEATLHMRFDGNPGTGKTTVARLVGAALRQMALLPPTAEFVETGGAALLAEDRPMDALKKMLNEKLLPKSGTLFIDEMYTLNPKTNKTGAQMVNYLLKAMEDNRDKLVCIVAGYGNEMDEACACPHFSFVVVTCARTHVRAFFCSQSRSTRACRLASRITLCLRTTSTRSCSSFFAACWNRCGTRRRRRSRCASRRGAWQRSAAHPASATRALCARFWKLPCGGSRTGWLWRARRTGASPPAPS
jgi:hypothetical protein